jgi:hypothetical protein
LQVFVRQRGEYRQMAQEADLERAISMNRNRKTNGASRLAVNMVTTGDSQQLPTAALELTARTRGRK